ncbi:MAG: ATP-binding protein [bacterium]|nr:ATP-binding protein [bacterium]
MILVLLREEGLWSALVATSAMAALGLILLLHAHQQLIVVERVVELHTPSKQKHSGATSRAATKSGLLLHELLGGLETRLSSSEEGRKELLTILQGMAEGVLAVDTEERLVHINAAGAAMLGIGASQALGMHVWEATRVTAVIEVLRSTLTDQREAAGEMRLPTAGGDRYLELHASPLHSAGGHLTGAVVVLHDTTQLRRLEQVRRDFVTNVGHELRTPLTAIHALVETVLDDTSMNQPTRDDFLQKTLAQSQRLQTLVADLLLLSRVESHERTILLERIDLAKPVSESLSTLGPAAQAKGIRIDLQPPEAPIFVTGDREMLRQAAGNLIDNAIKYSHEGSSIEVRLERNGVNAHIVVRDNGLGIPLDDQTRIFERFYRVDKARSREVVGTGLGLAIVKHIVLAHKGNVRIASKLGHGSTFTIELPLADA